MANKPETETPASSSGGGGGGVLRDQHPLQQALLSLALSTRIHTGKNPPTSGWYFLCSLNLLFIGGEYDPLPCFFFKYWLTVHFPSLHSHFLPPGRKEELFDAFKFTSSSRWKRQRKTCIFRWLAFSLHPAKKIRQPPIPAVMRGALLEDLTDDAIAYIVLCDDVVDYFPLFY